MTEFTLRSPEELFVALQARAILMQRPGHVELEIVTTFTSRDMGDFTLCDRHTMALTLEDITGTWYANAGEVDYVIIQQCSADQADPCDECGREIEQHPL